MLDFHLKKAFLLLFFIMFFPLCIFSKEETYQEDIINPFENNQTIKTLDKRKYQSEEISEGFYYFRRWEIITLGAFPFIFLLASITYDISKYAYYALKGDENASVYSPFSRNSDKGIYNKVENASLIGGAFLVSTIVALVDHLILKKKIENGYYQRPYRY